MFQNLKSTGEPFGVTFRKVRIMSNSRKAILASEFARDQGRFDRFHAELFHAYFTEGRNIGQTDVLLDIGRKVGLDPADLRGAVEGDRYGPRLEAVIQEAQRCGIHAVPTFVLQDGRTIVGARPIETFRSKLSSLLV